MLVECNLFDLHYLPLVALPADQENVLHDHWPVHIVKGAVFDQLPVLVGLHVVCLHF
jgi:hypothetical protein